MQQKPFIVNSILITFISIKAPIRNVFLYSDSSRISAALLQRFHLCSFTCLSKKDRSGSAACIYKPFRLKSQTWSKKRWEEISVATKSIPSSWGSAMMSIQKTVTVRDWEREDK